MEINILLFYSFLMTLKLLQKQIISFYGMKKQKFGAHAKTEGGEYLRVTCAEGHSVVQIEESIPSFLDPRSDTVEKAWLTMSLLVCMCF